MEHTFLYLRYVRIFTFPVCAPKYPCRLITFKEISIVTHKQRRLRPVISDTHRINGTYVLTALSIETLPKGDV
jgi:hypothetical protein